MAVDSEPMAVIGVATRFPDEASTTEGLWSFLLKKRSAFRDFPSDRIGKGHYHPSPDHQGSHAVQGGHFLNEDPALFDAPFFSLTKSEVQALDPQQRLVLENVYHALENSGLAMHTVAGTDASCYVSGFNHDHLLNLSADPETGLKYRSTGTTNSLLSNRVSWFYDLKGPSMTLDTACSSSMVALHLACQSLKSGESSISIVSGVTQIGYPTDIIGMSNHGFLGQKGRCFTFDHRADGYARGEGVGTIIVKRLSDAVRDGDMIRGVIRATGVNQDGRTPGISLPSSEAQEKLIRKVYASAGLDTKDTMMVEAHGTGTPAGDPLEAAAISRSFASKSRQIPLFVGALKSGIGHLEGAAGVAGVIKSILVLEQGVIPPNANFEKPNRRIPMAQYNIQFPLEPTPFPVQEGGIRRISINSFGVGGTNGHAILDDAYSYLTKRGLAGRHNTRPTPPTADQVKSQVAELNGKQLENGHANGVNGHANGVNGHANGVNGHANGTNGVNGHVNGVNGHSTSSNNHPARLVMLSSFDKEGITRNAELQSKYLSAQRKTTSQDDEKAVDSFAYTMNKRSVFAWRSFATGSTREELVDSLQAPVEPLRVRNTPSLGFVFTGQGAQWYAMGRELLSYPVFEKGLRDADAYYKSLGADWLLMDELLLATKEDSRLNQPWLAHPACSALQMATVDLLQSWGVIPKRVVGHSSGEIAAAYCAGRLTRQGAWKTAYFRGVVSAKQLQAKGSMMAVGLGPSALAPYVERANSSGEESGAVVIACLNSPKNCTVSGDDNKIEALQKLLVADNIFARKLSVLNAYHSAHMKEVAPEYLSLLGDLPRPEDAGDRAKSVAFFSTLSGQEVTEDYLPASYWVDNLVSPVQFEQGVCTMLASTVTKGQAGLKLNSTGRGLAIDLVLEIGPHSAMQSAIRENIATRSDAQAITTLGLLSRSNANLASVLKNVGQMWMRGLTVDMAAVNQVDCRAAPDMDVQLPGYSFNHSGDRNMYESRLVRNYRLREKPRHDLLGAPVPDWNVEHPRWRHHLRVEEQPWLRDHQITDSIIFPAVGYMIAALEAARQLVDPKDTVAGFRFRDVALKRALVIPDSKEGVETNVAMTRMDESSMWGSLVWRRFHVSSFNPVGDDWIEHCTGYIAVDLVTADGPIDAGREHREAVQRYERTISEFKNSCSIPVDIESIYDNLVTAGVQFGPLFRNINRLQGTPSKAGEVSGFIGVPDIASSMPKNFTHHHLVHPATLDPMLQLFLMSLLDLQGGKTLNRPIVPTFIKEAWVSAQMDPTPACQYYGHAKSQLLAYDKYESHVAVYDEASSDLRVSFKGVRATFLDSTDSNTQSARALCHELTWTPHLESLTQDFLSSQVSLLDREANNEYATQINRFQSATLLLVLDALAELGDDKKFEGHFQKYYDWMKSMRQWLAEDKISGLRKTEFEKLAANPAAKEALIREVEKHNADGELAVRMGTVIPQILRKEKDALALMFGHDKNEDDDLMDRVYGQVAHLGDLPTLQNEYLKVVRENKTNLRILEIGAGVGSSTVPMLEQLTTTSADGSTVTASHIDLYTFTDISAGFFTKAKDKFRSYVDLMEFKVLDATKDVADQPFELGSYDFVVAQNVIHATADLRYTLSNARKLLKPGGRLLLQEGVRQDFWWSGIAFGLLPGWWQGVEPIRQWSPWVSKSQWDTILRDAGYSGGIDMELADRQDESLHTQSLLVATNESRVDPPAALNGTVIITTHHPSKGLTPLVRELKLHLEEKLGVSPVRVMHHLDDGMLAVQDTICLSVMELERPVLESLSEDEMVYIRQMITLCKGLLWVTGDATENPSYAMIEGLLRSNRWERDIEDANLVPLHIASSISGGGLAAIKYIIPLYEKQFVNTLPLSEINGEYAVCPKTGTLLTSRLVVGQQADTYLASKFSRPQPLLQPFKSAGRPVRLATAMPGLLDKLEWVTDETYTTPLNPTDIEVEVKAVGLNFRDVMIAMGEHMANSMGCEAAGVITRVGPSVDKDKFKPGDRIVYLTGHQDMGTFHTLGRVDASMAVPIPDSLPYEIAAGLPCVYATAIYGLCDVARLEPGETVLIHAAAGGVGQAAIQVARHRGAGAIFCTVSSNVKRDLLVREYGIPEEHIFSSRDTSFVAGVRRMTEGNGGVDVVLNSLSGEMLRNSWEELLAPFGRFIEIGKRDAQANGKISLSPYLRSVTMASVELPTMMRHRPGLIRRLTADAVALWEQGVIKAASPTTIMGYGQMEEALRILQGGKGLGKIVMVPNDEDVVPIVPAQPPAYRFGGAEASYVISGGLGGIGRSVAVWMADRGAKELIFLSRSGIVNDEVKEMQTTLQEKGCVVKIFKCDVSDEDRVKEVAEELKATSKPVKGVIQGAMTLDDVMFENMSFQSFQTAVKPKVQGSWNLHTHFPKDMDFFVMLSSATGVLGNRSQSNYAAGNTYQDALAVHRRSLGLAASTVDLGTVLAVGYVAKNRHRTQVARHLGTVLETLREDEIHALMEYCIDSQTTKAPAQLVTGLTNIAMYRARGMPPPTYMGYPLFANLRVNTVSRSGRAEGGDGFVVEALLNAAQTWEQAAQVVQDAIIKKLSGLLAVPTDNVDPAKSISSNGVDSLVAMEFRAFLAKEVKADIPVLDIMGTLSLAAVAKKAASISQAVDIRS